MAGKIKGIRLAGRAGTGVYFFEFPDGDISKGRRDVVNVTSGQDAIPVRTRVHFDFTPVDEDGQDVGPGDPRLQGFHVDAFISNPGLADLNQTGEADPDHGCTPVTSKIGGEGSFSVRAYAVVNGQRVGEEVTTPEIRVS